MSTTDLSTVLIAAGWAVELHNVLFKGEGEKPDHEWIPVVTARRCTIITSDKRAKSWKTEGGLARKAIEDGKAKVFFLKSAGLLPKEQAKAVLAAERSIRRCVKKHAGTYVLARIHSGGSRLGEVEVQQCGGTTKTERRYGSACE